MSYNLTQKQQYFKNHATLIYIYSSTTIALYVPAAFFIGVIVFQVLKKSKTRGFVLWLLIAIGISLVLFASGLLQRMLTIRNFVNTPSDNID